ncbi:hypothetical protein EJB05_28323 [Eragrostis curvula]|uniref:VWFA domain-containing protein n=1 Tax=Eragrostis curvula TaxID=38414 RepID=A0A5J9UQ01_9POAL|nr:hypothetical protein EJB05_28323 [Eragrostis curvula]
MDSQAPAASALQLSTFTKVSSIPRNERYPEFPVTVTLAAPGPDRPVRGPVDIVVAIDISQSSRTNDPMLELEKDVLEIIIEKLGPADRLASGHGRCKEMATLVAMCREGSKKVKGLVEQLKYSAGGGTVFVKPVNKAQKILKERADAHRAAFIVLLSDGGDRTVLQDKVWERESELKSGTPKPKYYPVQTFGFTKHDPETLSHIAKKTNGTHYAGDIAGIGDLGPFDTAFEALLSAAASRPFEAAAVSASLAAEHPGVSIARIDAGSGERKAVISGDARAGGVDVGVINAGETPEFTVYLDVPEGDADADVMKVLSVDGAYTQGWDGKVVSLGLSVVSVKRPEPTKPEAEPKTPQEPETPQPQEPEKKQPNEPETSQDPETKKPKEPETPQKPETPQDPCKPLYEIEERLKYWCKVKADLSAMNEKADAGNKCDCHFTAVQREAALESINRAMHHDIYTASALDHCPSLKAVVLAIKTRRCGEAPSDKKAEAGVATADK